MQAGGGSFNKPANKHMNIQIHNIFLRHNYARVKTCPNDGEVSVSADLTGRRRRRRRQQQQRRRRRRQQQQQQQK